MDQPPRVGIIGTRWGLMHLGAFRAAGATVTALCGSTLDSVRATAAREGVALATTRVEELCASCDLVVVASPDRLHAEHVRTVLDHDRHVLCEKPLAFTKADADDLVRRAAATSRVTAVSFGYRALPSFVALRHWLETRSPVRHVSVTLRSSFAGEQPAAEGWLSASADFGGVSHVIDAVLWLTRAAPTWVNASLQGRPAHSVALQLGLGSAVATVQHLASVEPGTWGDWVFEGDGWSARLGGGYVPRLGGWRIGQVHVFSPDHRTLAPEVLPTPGSLEPWAEAHVELARRVLARVRGETAALTSFAEAARIQAIVEASMTSQTEARRVSLTQAAA